MIRAIILVLVMLYAPAVTAASFCMVGAGMPLQCIYDDAAVCLKEAEPPTTSCTINPDALLNYSGNSRYCTVSSSQVAECIYSDRSQCNAEAQQRSGVCVDRVGMNEKNNPYQYDPRVQY